jgi:hypothetical protein
MDMQNNEMDKLFRSKLEGLEIEPSARVWENISDKLGAPVKRRNLIPFLRVAASVVLLISAGLLLLPKKQISVTATKHGLAHASVVKPAGKVKAERTNQKPGVSPFAQVNTLAQVVKPGIKKPKQAATALFPSQQVTQIATVTIGAKPLIGPVEQSPLTNDKPLIANNTNRKPVNTAVVPDAATPIAIKQTDVPPVAANKQSDVLAAVNTPDNDLKPTPPKKRKIHGLGSLLNAVVGVVDKRQDKIIEFADTDEGDTVTGINLGLIKVKKVN